MNEILEKHKSQYLSHKEAAAYLGISPKTLYHKVAQGIIPVYRFERFQASLYRLADLQGLFKPVN